MVKMRNGGITTSVPENEVSFYKRAGYVVVEDPKPVEPVAPAKVEPAAPEKKAKK